MNVTSGLTHRVFFRLILPLSFLTMTCCMAQVEAQTRSEQSKAATPAPEASAAATVSVTAPLPDANDAALLLAQKSSKFGAQKPKPEAAAPPANAPEATTDEEEDEEEEADEEDADAEEAEPAAGGGFKAKTIQADFDQNVLATLKDVVVRGSILSVTVALSYQGGSKDKRGKDKAESEFLSTSNNPSSTHILDYDSGTTYPVKKHDGFTSGRLSGGQTEKTLRVTFDAPPKSVQTVGITIYGIGTFDDVSLRPAAPARPPKKTGKTAEPAAGTGDEEDEEDDEEDEEDEAESLAPKKKGK